MGLRGTPDPAMAGGGGLRSWTRVPYMFVFCLSHMRERLSAPQASRVPQPSGKAAPTAPGCYGATGREAPDGNMVGGALWILRPPRLELQAPLLCSKATYRTLAFPGEPRPPHALGGSSDQGRAIWRWGLWGTHRAVCGKEPASFLARSRCYADRTGSRGSPGTSVGSTPTSGTHGQSNSTPSFLTPGSA